MAIIPKEEEKNKPAFRYSIVIIFAAAVFGSLASFFWPVSLPDNFKETILSRAEKRLNELQLNLAVLQDPVFQSLKSHGESPIAVIEGGRANPFNL